MKTYIVGHGAVGTYLGDALRAAGSDVVYAPRSLDEVRLADPDLVIVATKAYDTDGAIATLRKALGEQPQATIFCPQNGVGNEEKLAAAFGADKIVAGALTTPVDRTKDGRSVAASKGGIALAPMGGTAHNWLVAAFEQTGIPTRVVSDYRSLKWSKLSLNIIANATCAILNVLPERLVTFDEVFSLEIRAIREVRAVMRALGVRAIDLPRYPVRALQSVATLPPPVARLVLSNRIAGARGRKPPSLLLDLRAGKGQTEVDVLNGAVVAAGSLHGVKTPINAVLARVLSDIAHMPQLWAKYRERPLSLQAEVEAEVRRVYGPRVRLIEKFRS
ncbi:MAG TPA: 2-dehydropantoate 2-reductase N-terminal domain-containing protein [Candidatus Baltobacteraceae bacterium]